MHSHERRCVMLVKSLDERLPHLFVNFFLLRQCNSSKKRQAYTSMMYFILSTLCSVLRRRIDIYLFENLIAGAVAMMYGSGAVFQKSAGTIGELTLNFSDDGYGDFIGCFC